MMDWIVVEVEDVACAVEDMRKLLSSEGMVEGKENTMGSNRWGPDPNG